MSPSARTRTRFRVSSLPNTAPTAFSLTPDAAELRALAEALDLSALRKLRFEGELRAQGAEDWRIAARLGATVVQPCVVTLEPVTTRIDVPVDRLYMARYEDPDAAEVEMPEDDSIEALPDEIDLEAVMTEALALNLPVYPRAEGADTGEAVFTEPGKTPLRDADLKPFAGLATLRDKLAKDD